MKRGLEKAAAQLPPEIRAAFRRAFKATGVMDLYDGDLASYLTVIASTIEHDKKRIKRFEQVGEKIYKLVEDQRSDER
jgi:hypothetical protein